MRAATLTWMALRELWISFRFLALLAVGLLGGLLAATAGARGWNVSSLLAWGMGAAGVVAAGLAASRLATERRSGRIAWLAVRSVPRSATLLAWFGSMALPLLAGLVASALLGWLVAGTDVTGQLDAPGYAAVALAAIVTTLEVLALGLAAGSLLDALPATVTAVLVGGALLLVGGASTIEPPVLPSAGMGLLAEAATLARPLSDGLQATGLALAGMGLLLAVAAAALSRADL